MREAPGPLVAVRETKRGGSGDRGCVHERVCGGGEGVCMKECVEGERVCA